MRRLPRVVFGIYDHAEADVTGSDLDGVIFPRQPGEALADLHRRAFAATGALTAATLYAARQSPPERDSGPASYRPPLPRLNALLGRFPASDALPSAMSLSGPGRSRLRPKSSFNK